ncbi:MAG: four helix bundle protein [Akkermansiaceae bacterium]|nr:four helix bundle protein [Akkermansiaceae bacterium]
MDDILAKLSFDFATSVILACDEVKNRAVIKNQLIKAATSVGANIREANYGYSDADFLAKMQIALKECFESQYWLELMVSTFAMKMEEVKPLLKLCGNIRFKLICSIKTVKTRLNTTVSSGC